LGRKIVHAVESERYRVYLGTLYEVVILFVQHLTVSPAELLAARLSGTAVFAELKHTQLVDR